MSSVAVSPEEWEAISGASSCRTVFAQQDYVRAMAPVSAGRPLVLGNADAGWGACLVERSRPGFREIIMPLLTPFSGLALAEFSESDAHAGRDALAALGEVLEGDYQRIRLHLPPALTDPRPLQWRGWSVSPLFTYRVDLSGDWAANWSSGARRTLRKHEGAYSCGIDAGALVDVIALMGASYERRDREPPVDPTLLLNACQALGTREDSALIECAVARNEAGVLEAGVVLLHGPEASYYWIAGSKPGPAMTVLAAFCMQHLSDQGVNVFDMVGANTPTIAEFKRRLGARLERYYGATYESGMVMKALRAGRTLRGS